MRSANLRIVLSCVIGSACSGAPEHRTDPDAAITPDSAVDAAQSCPASITADVSYGGESWSYVAFGHVDAGGEANCGPPAEAVRISLGRSSAFADVSQLLWFALPLDVTTGSRSVTFYAPGAVQGAAATFDVTLVMQAGPGPELELFEGTFQGPGITGTLSAHECAALTYSCI